jgi:hypothetical protein
MTISTLPRTTAYVGIVVSGLAAFLPPNAIAGGSVGGGQGIVTQLGPYASAVTYWAAGPEGWDVVTTIDPLAGYEAGRNGYAVIRFSARLLPGQSQTISVPAAFGDQSPSLLIRRVADRIEVETTPVLSH